ncbi:hypothetical protein [Bradyrhizobium glycinis]|uniref:hypothetical protein n=1 Tax=Bradyrhizobium glycinis TaxID=2751812 RepID=UPI0018D9A338|nr:hypothetical protein [Bradyrhizobium glycinis]MBH5370551.1 hypothetical protein [Bradyrhizobium glycinis]
MLRRSFLLALGGLGLSTYTARARTVPQRDFRTADLMGGAFAMQTSQLALTRTSNPFVETTANEDGIRRFQPGKSFRCHARDDCDPMRCTTGRAASHDR